MHQELNSPLRNIIINYIRSNGFITLESFISLCLNHNEYGYYCKKSPIGKNQDFTTAPEISQLFGEMLGLWTIDQWQKLNQPTELNLIELGPGNGTLMLDILNIIKNFPTLLKSLHIYLIEINKVFKNKQYTKLLHYIKQYNINIHWLSHINEIKSNTRPNIIIANEFLDALPPKQFKYKQNNWHEIIITTSPLSANNFIFALHSSPTNLNKYLPVNFIPKENMIYEYSPTTLNYFSNILNLLNKNKGSALFIDYGYSINPCTNTIQAIKDHKPANYLNNLGNADITYLVNFPLLLQQLQSHSILYKMNTQKEFFKQLGIYYRIKKLLKIAKHHQKKNIILGVNRILSSKHMGTLFKVLEINKY